MSETTCLTNHFLIAMPALADPNFAHTVTYICEHNEKGTMGIVVNRPLDIHLGEMMNQMKIGDVAEAMDNKQVYLGGPVQQELGFVLHNPTGNWESTINVNDGLAVTTSRDILTAMAHGQGPDKALVALGYAGWGSGQLEREIAENAWLSGPADSNIIFHLSAEKRWEAAAALLGIELQNLSGDIGHA